MRDFERFFEECRTYLTEYGNLYVPVAYKKNDYKLGEKVHNVRRGLIRTDEKEKARLDKLGFVWRVISNYPFAQIYLQLCIYKAKNGNLDMPASFMTASGIPLGRLARNIRIWVKKVDYYEKQKLSEIGFEFQEASKGTSHSHQQSKKVKAFVPKPINKVLICEASIIEDVNKKMDSLIKEAKMDGYYPLESLKIRYENDMIVASQTVVLLE